MTHNCAFLLLTVVAFVAADPLILALNKYHAGGFFIVDGTEDSPKLYVASADDRAALRNISVRSGNGWISLDQIADYNSDGTPKYLNLTDGLEIKTVNDDVTTNALTGYIYVTTYQQAHDPTFAVYVINGKQTISRDGMKTTTVVLNTQLGAFTDVDEPTKTSYVTNIQQSSNTNLYFMWGVPPRNWYDVTNATFFQNPLMLTDSDSNGTVVKTRVFFDHVEPLQIGLDYWYFMSMGPVNMDIENKYVSAHNYTTTSVNTTGLIVNNFLYKDHQVNFLLDRTRNRTVGTYISTFLTSPVTFFLGGDTGGIAQTYDNTMTQTLMTSYFQADRLLINTTYLLPGTFYCQYYGFSGELLSVTNAPSTIPTTRVTTNTPMATTPTIATTTKSSRTDSFANLLILFIASRFLY